MQPPPSPPQPPGPAAVVGTTTWGTTLAVILARRGVEVRLLARTDAEAARLSKYEPAFGLRQPTS